MCIEREQMNFQDVIILVTKEFDIIDKNSLTPDWRKLSDSLIKVIHDTYDFDLDQVEYVIKLANKNIKRKDPRDDFYNLIYEVEKVCEIIKNFPK